MAYDALTLSVLCTELQQQLIGGKINRIYQPEKDEIILTIFNKKNYRLLISANASVNRIHLTERNNDNPSNAPTFCMLLRKHLINAQIINIEQMPFERVLDITLVNKNDLGYTKNMHLIFELTGKTSNIILTDENYIVIDSIKHLPTDMDSKRIILNGAKYAFFPPQDKILPNEYDKLRSLLKENKLPLRQTFIDNVLGVSQSTVAEIFYGTQEDNITDETINTIVDNTKKYLDLLTNPQPCILLQNGSMVEQLPFPYKSKKGDYTPYPTLNIAHDDYYYYTDKYRRFQDKAKSINTIVKNAISRTEKKLAIQKQSIIDASTSQENKIYGDLILSNLHLIKQGDSEVKVINYYDELCPEITIKLDQQLSPQQNAQKYYKKYQKQKSTIEHNTQLVEENTNALQYLMTVQQSLKFCTDATDLNEITEELTQAGIIKAKRTPAKNNSKGNKGKATVKNEPIVKPLHYVIDGYDVYVGKNNTQNNYVTFKLAKPTDIWLHTHDIHSSHAIIVNDNNDMPPDNVLVTAGEIVAFYSQARNSSKVPIDYTHKQNVKKPSKSALGFVNYLTYYTMIVNPNEHRLLLKD